MDQNLKTSSFPKIYLDEKGVFFICYKNTSVAIYNDVQTCCGGSDRVQGLSLEFGRYATFHYLLT